MEWSKILFIIFLQMLYFSPIRNTTFSNCKKEDEYSGEIKYLYGRHSPNCWKIEVHAGDYVWLNVAELTQNNLECEIQINVAGTDEGIVFCGSDTNRKPIIALNDVTIAYNTASRFLRKFKIVYSIKSIICAQNEHFRCSSHSCIRKYQVCDGVKDCENGADEKGCEKGVAAVRGVNISRENTIRWLRSQMSASSGWNKNTHRAITALYLTGAADFESDKVEEVLMAKQLELQTSVALLRNSTDPLSVSDLSMFINALTVTCHNPRLFYGYDLVQILGERVVVTEYPSPAAYLTLCSRNWTFSESYVEDLLQILHKHSDYPFHLDIQAMTVMALACVQNKTNNFEDFEDTQNATELYNAAIQQLLNNQLPDGNFGNIYTTALVTQALLSSGQENNELWKLNSTVNYLIRELDASTDFLSAYLALPVFNGKSLLDVAAVKCKDIRKHGEDDGITDVTSKLGGKMRIQYSLYIGDQKDIIHTMYLRMPEMSSAYDVMKKAQAVDHKYKFLHRDMSGHMYVYSIAGITNDPEAGKFWLLYSGESRHANGTVKHHSKCPDKYILQGGENLIMWYRRVHM